MTDARAEPSRGEKFANTLRAPGWIMGLTVFLICFGFLLIAYVPDQLASIFAFSILALILYHFVFAQLRNITNDKALKIVDYLYLGLALFGVGGIIDIQSKMANERYIAVVEYYMPQLEKLKPCKNPKGKECDFANSMMNIVRTPDPAYYRTAKMLDRMMQGFRDYKLADENISPFLGKFDEMVAVLDERAIPYMRPARSGENQFIWFYILAVSLALRITKVTVELREWHVPKEGKAKPMAAAEPLVAS
ncbi:hypothetical protein JQ628_02050 [Bradyrhizobium lablabi]|uniref:hypothetical protein n=1 Tax=Bradyrhizobium lablabi TaxID=722472 RepID=UPI001BA808DE|nr:hypothetical protein [Bradyrhizobium lablabi]MBR1120281.1 hypothetical protein [Bradyrhizobium lablabi]